MIQSFAGPMRGKLQRVWYGNSCGYRHPRYYIDHIPTCSHHTGLSFFVEVIKCPPPSVQLNGCSGRGHSNLSQTEMYNAGGIDCTGFVLAEECRMSPGRICIVSHT